VRSLFVRRFGALYASRLVTADTSKELTPSVSRIPCEADRPPFRNPTLCGRFLGAQAPLVLGTGRTHTLRGVAMFSTNTIEHLPGLTTVSIEEDAFPGWRGTAWTCLCGGFPILFASRALATPSNQIHTTTPRTPSRTQELAESLRKAVGVDSCAKLVKLCQGINGSRIKEADGGSQIAL